MTKEERTLVIIDRLKKEYPDAGCTLIRPGSCLSASV
jgi:hypothetical protein